MALNSSDGYAGDVDPPAVWTELSQDPASILVDVRTKPEWSFVGIPHLAGIGKEPVLLEWQTYPSMAVDDGFVTRLAEALAARGAGPDTPIYFLCRSGARSRSAAIAMTAAGYGRCYNVAGGFEGRQDVTGHRGTVEGWKAVGLPWKQN